MTQSLQKLANAIRFLSMDAVQKANSGHPGAPMGMADIATVLWREFLQVNPANPQWFNRDRFVLSNGHASMLLYSLLYLTGYPLTIEDLKQFRQLHSNTPGHPEVHKKYGVETTTGPLGQGLANAVGMALAERVLGATFNRPDFPIVDHYTYVFLGDGCLMEGISHEVCSLAGTLHLGKLIAFWDNNKISIDGDVESWFTDNTPERFRAYGWQVIADVDGHDFNAVREAIMAAKAELQRPTLICCRTQIAHGAPHAGGTHQAHGAPLGDKEIAATREALGWSYPPFVVPDEILTSWNLVTKGTEAEEAWRRLFEAYEKTYPDLAAEFIRRQVGLMPGDFTYLARAFVKKTLAEAQKISTRRASQLTLDHYAPNLPEIFGGSADLTCSNLTNWIGYKPVTAEDMAGNYLFYGVREFGMSAMMNGMSLHGGFIPFGGTFLTFTDYARNAVRMAAIMQLRVIFVYTHDSIGLGEDGPTHQPIEHLAMLRLTPGLSVWRPADLTETAVAWQLAVERYAAPTCLVFARQNVDSIARTEEQAVLIARGGYMLRDHSQAQVVLIATGSEVTLVLKAVDVLAQEKIFVRVVSMPCTDVFDVQSEEYRESVLSKDLPRIAVEAAAADYWYKYVGLTGKVIGLHQFGLSAPTEAVFAAFDLTVDRIVREVRELISKD